MTIPSTIVSDIASSTSAIFGGSLPLIIILFGISIAFFIVRHLVSLLPKG